MYNGKMSIRGLRQWPDIIATIGILLNLVVASTRLDVGISPVGKRLKVPEGRLDQDGVPRRAKPGISKSFENQPSTKGTFFFSIHPLQIELQSPPYFYPL